jgi:xanthine dehydrogenase accessory factor
VTRRLFVIGRGTTAERIAELGGGLGYDELSVREDAPGELLETLGADDHLLVAAEDTARARAILTDIARARALPGYVGYAAPHREGWKALVALAAKEVPKERIDRIAAPAGVDIGAETPEEVAIAVAAELVALRRGRALPSAGLEVGAPARRQPIAEARPRRLIGGFGRPAPSGAGDPDDGKGGRN